MGLVEMLIVTLIMASLFSTGFLVLSSGKSTWFTSNTSIELQESLRKTLERISMELRQSRVGQGQIFNGTGFNNTDIIRFSIPVVCEAGQILIDVNADVSYWRAPLTWGCTDSACMDADDDCSTVDYSAIEYYINNSNQLIRRILNSTNATVREDVFAGNISDFQIVMNAGGVVNLSVAAQKTAENNRLMTAQTAMDIYLRN